MSKPTHGFPSCRAEKQSEVVKYAAVHIAKNSKLLELTGMVAITKTI